MAVAKIQYILDNLGNISRWIKEGMFENQIFPKLGMSKPTWEKYKKECPQLREVLQQSRQYRNEHLIPELENLMLKRARGYTSEDTEEVYKEENGNVTYTKKIIKKEIPPDVGAIQICLKNFTRDNEVPWTDNPQGDKFKKAKQDLEEKIFEEKKNGWF